jgi:uncharacterized membrane protein
MGARMDVKANQAGISTFLSSDRLASLSDTIFGVAMTLLATTLLPSVQTFKGSALDTLLHMNGELALVVLGFAISGTYWVVQQQRLAMTRSVTAMQTLLHFAFLFLIVLLPISTSLWGSSGVTKSVVMIYGAHLALISLFNLLLWIDVHRVVAAHVHVVRSILALALFVVSLAIGAVWPHIAQYLWFVVFATPLLADRLTRRLYGT